MTHGCSSGLFIKGTLEHKVSVVQAEVKQLKNGVSWHDDSLGKFCISLSKADGIGMEVNNAGTSYEVMHSPSSNFISFISSANCLELLRWCGEQPLVVWWFWLILWPPHMKQIQCCILLALGGCPSCEFWVAHRILEDWPQYGTSSCRCYLASCFCFYFSQCID